MVRTTTTPRRKSKLRRAAFSDYRQIVALQSRYGLGADTEEEWLHIWQGNPLYRELQKDWDIGWVIQEESGRIVGWVGNVPVGYELAGKRIVGTSGRALAVEPEHRAATPMLLNSLIHQRTADLYLNCSIGGPAVRMFEAFECPRVPVGLWDRAAFWITSPRAFFERIAGARLPAALAKPLSYPLGAASLLRDSLAVRNWQPHGIEVRTAEGFDERFDLFWEDLKSRKSDKLLAVRTRAVLNWHFRRALLSGRLWIATMAESSRLTAYAIFERCDHSRYCFTRMRLVDFQSLDKEPAYLLAALSWAVQRCRDRGIQMLEVLARWLGKGEPVAVVAPYIRRLPNWTYFYRASDPDLARRLDDAKIWEPTLYDGDASL